MGVVSGGRRWRLWQKSGLDVQSNEAQTGMSQQQQPQPHTNEVIEHGHRTRSSSASLRRISSTYTHQVPIASADYDAEGAIDPDADIERLGRQRPPVFKNWASEAAFCFSIVMSQVLTEYFISGFNVIIPRLVDEFDIPDASAVWPASAFPLVVSSTLLISGRLADMVGGYYMYVGGMGWLCVWSIIASFCNNRIMLILCRALQGLGPAAYLPSGMMLLSIVYRPGPRKNLVFSLYGTCAVFGFFIGIFCSGLAAQYLAWQWYFRIGAILAAITTVSSFFFVPSDAAEKRKQGVKMDYLGSTLIVVGLTLFVFAITDSAHASQGWKTPYVYVSFILGCLFLAGAFYVEGWVAEWPLLPFDLFDAPYMKAMVLALLFFYGCLGVFLLYGTLYMVHIMGATSLQVVAWCTPMVVGGFAFPIMVGICLHLVSGTVLLIISGIGWIMAGLLFAIMPDGASYWAYAFPAMIGATLGIDVTFNITNIFITTSQPKHRQGLAGALINSVLFLSIAVLLGFADVAQVATLDQGRKQSYRVVFWFNTACASVALLIIVLFVRVNPAASDLTVDEKKRQHELSQRPLNDPETRPRGAGGNISTTSESENPSPS
ncbi:efflux pump [Trichophyton mentagrophytes]|nr:efflux pump [Trichophyton mentagrophytes]